MPRMILIFLLNVISADLSYLYAFKPSYRLEYLPEIIKMAEASVKAKLSKAINQDVQFQGIDSFAVIGGVKFKVYLQINNKPQVVELFCHQHQTETEGIDCHEP